MIPLATSKPASTCIPSHPLEECIFFTIDRFRQTSPSKVPRDGLGSFRRRRPCGEYSDQFIIGAATVIEIDVVADSATVKKVMARKVAYERDEQRAMRS